MSRTKNYIGKIADLFSVPIATLRYWGKEGLVKFDQSEKNGYRTWSMHTLRTLCDITLYRQLSIPIHELKHIHSLSHQEISSLLLNQRQHISDTISDLQDKLNHIEIKLNQVNTVQDMNGLAPQLITCSLPAIQPYELLNKDNLSHLYDHEKELVILIRPDSPSMYSYGRCVTDGHPKEGLLREEDKTPRLYLHTLLKSSYENPADNDLNVYYEYLKRLDCRPGITVGKVLVSAFDGALFNYYDTYIEVLDVT